MSPKLSYQNDTVRAYFQIHAGSAVGLLSSIIPLLLMSEIGENRAANDDEIRETIMAKLIETGEKDRLKDMLRDRLIQSGWRDELKEHCKDVIKRRGLEKVTVEELVAEITPHGRSKIPEEVKAELLRKIRFFLQST